MTKVIFTICSNNYLAQARTLGDSVAEYNSDYKFIIFLCDRRSKSIDYTFFEPHTIIEINEIGLGQFDEMVSRYNIIELNTSVKPFVFDYIFRKYPETKLVMYLDPDTYVCNSLTPVEIELQKKSVLLTPHIYTPIDFDGESPTENTFTQHGVFNLGFIAIQNDANSSKLLQWWMKRMAENCFNRPSKGIFVDQLPMNYAPIFFHGVKISNNWGINMAPWNLHERDLTLKSDKYFVNEKWPLIFYHFSNCNPTDDDSLSDKYTRITFENRPVLKKIYHEYKRKILENNYELYSRIQCHYIVLKNTRKGNNKQKSINKLKSSVNNGFSQIFKMSRITSVLQKMWKN